jgi:hypothetical protein
MSRVLVSASLVALVAFAGCGEGETPEAVATRTAALAIGSGPAADTFINSAFPDNNSGASTSIFTGRNGMNGMMRGLVRFSMPAELRAGGTITSAELRMTTRGLGNGETQLGAAATLQLESVGQSWSPGNGVGESVTTFTVGQACGGQVSGATWNQADCATSTSWTTPGGTVAGAVRGTADAPAAIGAVVVWASTAAMVADAQAWVDDPIGNHGWLITSSTESTTGAQRFYAQEAPSNGPQLLFTYTCKPGFVDSLSNFCVPDPDGGPAGAGGATGAGGTSGGGAAGSGPNGGSGCSCSVPVGNVARGVTGSLMIGALVWLTRRRRGRPT